ncbi:hypothetical protein Goari_004936, partial [Gossypium aridum]|nr:hypothetical protein [Gossypium aridum]
RYHLHSLPKGDAFLVAQQRESLSEDTSFTFLGYKIIRIRSALLGRPWDAYFKVIFALSYMSNVILPQGWDDWGDTSKRRYRQKSHEDQLSLFLHDYSKVLELNKWCFGFLIQ